MKNIKKQDVWFLAGLFGIGLILFWRCFYSVNTTDEAYYVGTVFRLWQGDGMLSDEWMPTQQMSSFWLYPFYALFRMILGSNDGMILAFRLLYIAVSLLFSSYVYGRLRGFGAVAIVPALFGLLSTAFNINSLSYNTMANYGMAALLVTLAVMKEKNTADCVIAGVLASIVVMANPYALFAYLLYAAVCIGASLIFRKSDKKLPVALRFGTVFKMSLTALAVLIVFLIFTLQNSTIEEVMENLPYIIGDEEHQQRWGVKFSDYFRYFQKYYPGCVIGNLLIGAVALADRGRKKRGSMYLLAGAACTLPYILRHGWMSDYVPVNLVTVPIAFMGFLAYILSEKKESRIFFCWYLPAMIYPFVVQLATNTGPLAVSAAFVSAGAAAVLLLMLWVKEELKKAGKLQKITGWIVSGIVILQLITMLALRITYVWADAPMSELTAKVDRGPAKGLYTTAETVEYYNEIYDDLDSIQMQEDDGLLIVGAAPMLYLYADQEVASYSTWRVYTNETRLYRYYEVHDGDGKFPEVVYCLEADETIYDSILVEKLLVPMGYEAKELEHGIAFYIPR